MRQWEKWRLEAVRPETRVVFSRPLIESLEKCSLAQLYFTWLVIRASNLLYFVHMEYLDMLANTVYIYFRSYAYVHSFRFKGLFVIEIAIHVSFRPQQVVIADSVKYYIYKQTLGYFKRTLKNISWNHHHCFLTWLKIRLDLDLANIFVIQWKNIHLWLGLFLWNIDGKMAEL